MDFDRQPKCEFKLLKDTGSFRSAVVEVRKENCNCQGVDYTVKLFHFVHFGLSCTSFAIFTILAHPVYL